MTTATPTRPLFGPYPIAALDDDAAPPNTILDLSDAEASDSGSKVELNFEMPRQRWMPIDSGGESTLLPVRFIDGSIVSRLAGSLTVAGRQRPLIASSIAAAALELRDRGLSRMRGAISKLVVSVYRDDIDPDVLEHAAALLREHGFTLLLRDMDSGPRDFDTLRMSTRNRAMDEMESCEREILLQDPAAPALVDGLLERRLVRVPNKAIPATGLVKRHAATYLPGDLQEMLYRMKPGQRSPAFVMEIDNVVLATFYLRLASPYGASPSYGVVRVTTPLAYLEQWHAGAGRSRYLSALAAYLYRLRHRDEGYD
ncbi:MAG: hypothetical protein AB7N70_38375, partial [Dehalococcoidia bacterium]